MRRVAIGFIKLYRYLLSPWVGNQCRFHPSCSHYGEQAIERHGVVKGSVLTVWRIVRCNPWHPGGFDYVPGTEDHQHHLSNNSCKEQRSSV